MENNINKKIKCLLEVLNSIKNVKNKIFRMYHLKIDFKNKNKQYIMDILNSIIDTNNKITIKNKNFEIFYEKLLDMSIQILKDEDYKGEPEIIINSKDLEKLGKDQGLIKLYIKLSLLFEEESLKILFHLLNHNKFSASSYFTVDFYKDEDFINIKLLNKAYDEEIIEKKNRRKIKISSHQQIKIVNDEKSKKEENKIKKDIIDKIKKENEKKEKTKIEKEKIEDNKKEKQKNEEINLKERKENTKKRETKLKERKFEEIKKEEAKLKERKISDTKMEEPKEIEKKSKETKMSETKNEKSKIEEGQLKEIKDEEIKKENPKKEETKLNEETFTEIKSERAKDEEKMLKVTKKSEIPEIKLNPTIKNNIQKTNKRKKASTPTPKKEKKTVNNKNDNSNNKINNDKINKKRKDDQNTNSHTEKSKNITNIINEPPKFNLGRPNKKNEEKDFKNKIIKTSPKKYKTDPKKNNDIEIFTNFAELKKNLFFKKVGDYLKEQREKYLKIYKNNEILNNKNFLNSCFDLNFHSSANTKYLTLIKTAQKLKTFFNNFNGIYKKDYGFAILNNIAYFYCNDIEEHENEVLFDSSLIKQANYTNSNLSNNLKLNPPSKEQKQVNYKPKTQGDLNTYVSFSGSNNSKPKENNSIDYYLFNGMDFKKNWLDFFDVSFGLDHLPSKFFSIKINENEKNIINNNFKLSSSEINFNNKLKKNFSFDDVNYNKYYYMNSDKKPFYKNYYNNENIDYKKKYNNIMPKNVYNKFDQVNIQTDRMNESKIDNLENIEFEIKFGDYIKNLFKVYIELDCARYNNKSKELDYNYIYKPFSEYEPFEVKKTKNGEWEINKQEEKCLKIYKNSIVLVEAKSSIPEKNIHINLDELIIRKKIQNSLYFVIYKLIAKIAYYKELYENEYSKEKEDIKFQLFLVYNSKPFSDLNDSIYECLNNLKKDGLIKYEFMLQVLYIMPSMSRYTMKMLGDIIKDNKREIIELKEKDIKKDKIINELKENICKNTKEIQELKETIEKLKSQIEEKKGEKKNH